LEANRQAPYGVVGAVWRTSEHWKEGNDMSYTHPYGQPQGAAQKFTNRLREVLIGEIIAINGYQAHIAQSDIDEINAAWHSIMLDEKKHYGWILQLLRKYDPEQNKQFLAHQSDDPGPKTPVQLQNSQSSGTAILNFLRDDVKGELEAVILYEEDLSRYPYEDIRKTLRAIIEEEKGHAEHLTRLLLKYDPDRYDELV
jgi:rubrerythrin